MALGPNTAARVREAESAIDAAILAAEPGKTITFVPTHGVDREVLAVLVERYKTAGWRNVAIKDDQREGTWLELVPPTMRGEV